MAHKKLMVRGFTDRHPIYGSDGNWCTEVSAGDKLICSFGGFGSEMLVRGAEYTVVECNGQLLLQATDGCIIGSFDTSNTMPFFLKVRQDTMEQNGHIENRENMALALTSEIESAKAAGDGYIKVSLEGAEDVVNELRFMLSEDVKLVDGAWGSIGMSRPEYLAWLRIKTALAELGATPAKPRASFLTREEFRDIAVKHGMAHDKAVGLYWDIKNAVHIANR